MELAHIQDNGIRVICQVRQAKTDLGIKFWCYVCNRYVLPDEKHKPDLVSLFLPSENH